MKINRKGVLSALAVLAAAAAGWLILWQKGAQTAYTKNLFAMDTFFVLKAYGPEAEGALREAEEKVRELERLFSVTVEGSDIWRIDHSVEYAGESAADQSAEGSIDRGDFREFPVSSDTLSVLETALYLGEETEGALDVTIYPILRQWGFTTGDYRVPDADEIETLLKKVDYRLVDTNAGKDLVRVPEGVELDLGAVAKGYTGDCLVDLLREAGVTSAILDLGGNVQTLGRKPDGSLWQVAVKNPFDTGQIMGVLQVADKAVITSGSYERYFIGEDGRYYWHILDPADGYPADGGLVSVTVVGDRGVICDGLSTALFVMGQERAVSYWREKQDFDVIFVTDEKKLYLTEGLAECFQGSEGWSAEIIKAAEE